MKAKIRNKNEIHLNRKTRYEWYMHTRCCGGHMELGINRDRTMDLICAECGKAVFNNIGKYAGNLSCNMCEKVGK